MELKLTLYFIKLEQNFILVLLAIDQDTSQQELQVSIDFNNLQVLRDPRPGVAGVRDPRTNGV
jgi:hypothetical protein